MFPVLVALVGRSMGSSQAMNGEQVLLFVVVVGTLLTLIAVEFLARQRRLVSRRAMAQLPTLADGPSLYVMAGMGQGGRMRLSGTLHIGRQPECQIRIDAPLVSRHHAVIEQNDRIWRIIDLESTNGTWVNGQRVTKQILRPNDYVQIGPSIFVFQPAGDEHTPSLQPSFPLVERPQPTTTSIARIHALSEYDLVEVGRGGEGVVYRGMARSDRSVVAIKILESQDPYLERKFKQVGEMGIRLRHPHIVAIYHFGQEGESYYIIMEYVDGGSLRDRLRINTPFPAAQAVRILGQTCEALDFAHRQQVIHRDVKPSNILFDSADQVKLSDFGIARILSQPTITQMGLILGTPEYMSYEQARGQPVAPQSDIYSLGVVAYQMFTGQLPFVSPDSDSWRIMEMHLKERPRPPRQLNPSLSPSIEAAILKATEKDINKRFRTAGEFARALGYGDQPPVAANPSNTPQAMPSVVGARLVSETGQIIPIAGTDFPVTRTVLGGHPSVSRLHARIVFQGNQYWLRDEKSTNGTWRNGQRVSLEWTPLHSNDTIVFGRVMLHFMVDP